MRNKIIAFTVGLTMLLTANRSIAGVITLYDGSSNVTPDQYNSPSPWLSFTTFRYNGSTFTPFAPVGTQSATGGVTTLDSTTSNNDSIYAGYSNYKVSSFSPVGISKVNPAFPTLDRNAGYTLSFTMKINTEADTSDATHPRAGFSVLVLSSDKQGIEIGFRSSEIFSQANAAFDTIGEQVTGVSSLLSSLNTYDLNVSGNSYTLTNGTTTLLNGLLRDYTAATGINGLASLVYNTPNYIFLGDNTTSARASVDIQSINLTTVPYEFSPTAGILALVAGGAVNHLLKKKKS
ncbi:PEP-CTERM sorting domain-containing protein [Nostoc sp. 106C]|uniref:PFE-CTERM domain-containing protein n=1 Tax=Nostoc sp. 106C TaxID=1932667 RepID=UPI000A362152|nr:PEP-CTERM sorting domain-containing protein [Nostoc sp. 106C]OUL33623.1 exosortase [Nostoc sp. 106C]